jgi:hypothetical protein
MAATIQLSENLAGQLEDLAKDESVSALSLSIWERRKRPVGNEEECAFRSYRGKRRGRAGL